MSLLSLSVLGPIYVEKDHQELGGLKNKTLALLVYLAVESRYTHRREELGNLFWPNATQQEVSNNLRQTLWRLRQLLGEAALTAGQDPTKNQYVFADRDCVRFNPSSSYWLDVEHFYPSQVALGLDRESAQVQVEKLKQMIAIYRGNFLEGFYLKDSNLFEEWAGIKREQYNRNALVGLNRLTSLLEANRDYAQAQGYARQQLEVDPYNEEGCRQLMRCLALSGQRSRALAQYDYWQQLLKADLGVEPSIETRRLVAAIQNETLMPPITDQRDLAGNPLNLNRESPQVPFLARQNELAKLDRFLKQALTGNGRAACISGEQGSGKTALLGAFERQALGVSPDLVPVMVTCNSISSFELPFLPFREMFHLLCGDYTILHTRSAIDNEYALRLLSGLPDMIRSILEFGPDLMGFFSVSPEQLLTRAETFMPENKAVLGRLRAMINQPTPIVIDPQIRQVAVFDQLTRVLRAFSQTHPLLLILDNIQRVDIESISMLFHLGKRLSGSRILIVGSFCPEELENLPNASKHSLKEVMNSLQRDYGELCIDLDAANGQSFVDAWLKTQPHHLSPVFREQFYRLTDGQPLFVVELWQNLCETGTLIKNAQGEWTEVSPVKWSKLPARVEAVVAQRLERQSPDMRKTLLVASVIGEEFPAEILARVMGVDEQVVFQRLHEATIHNLIGEVGLRPDSQRRLSYFRFRHDLFRRYLYQSIQGIARSRLHEKIAYEFESILGWPQSNLEQQEDKEQAANLSQLSYHFESADLPVQAAGYLLLLGKWAFRLPAMEPSIQHFTHALSLLSPLEETPEIARLKIELNFALGDTLAMLKGWGADEHLLVIDRAFELCQKNRTVEQLATALQRLATTNLGRGNLTQSKIFCQEYLQLAQRTGNEGWRITACYMTGQLEVLMGNFQAACTYLQEYLQSPLSYQITSDPGSGIDPRAAVRLMLASALIPMGHLGQAKNLCSEAVLLTKNSTIPFAMEYTLIQNAINLNLLKLKYEAVDPLFKVIIKDQDEQKLGAYSPWVQFFKGKVLVDQEQFQPGIALMRQGMAELKQAGSFAGRPFQIFTLAEACVQARLIPDGLKVIAEGLAFMQQKNVRLFASVFHRVQGDLLYFQGMESAAQAETCYQQALEIARQQGARFWELQALISLFHLRQAQGREAEVSQDLAACCAWFDAEQALPDLLEARRLLISSRLTI